MMAGIAWRYLELRPRSIFSTWLVSRTGWPTSRRASARRFPELRLEVNCSVKLVVAELLADRSPDAIRGGLRSTDNVTHILGDGDVQPTGDALITETPIRIMALSGSGWGGNVGEEAEFAEQRIKEAAPLVVIRIDELKDDRNMIGDVHGLEHSSGRNCGGSCIVVDGRGEGSDGRGVGVGGLVAVKRIDFHVRHGCGKVESVAERGEAGDERRGRRISTRAV